MATQRGRIVRCLRLVLEAPGLRPEEISYYNAHGTSTVVNDRVETEAVKEVFGHTPTRCRSARSRGRLGHSLGAASAIEAAVSVRALCEQMVPPTINYRPDPELDLDFVPARDGRRPWIRS